MNSSGLPESITPRRRRFISIAATFALVAVAGIIYWQAESSNSSEEPAPQIAQREKGVPKIPPAAPRVLPLPPAELGVEVHAEIGPRAEIVVDVDRDGKLRVDGKPAELDALRYLLAARQAEAISVGVTIRTDEECRFYHVRQVIRACDESAGVPYKLRALPDEGASSSS